jgi:hypothetical protein
MPNVQIAPVPSDTITVTISPENMEALKDYRFWTGASDSTAMNSAIAKFMESIGEIIMWDIARNPAKGQAAFERNNLTPDEQMSFSRKLDEDIEKSRRASQRQQKRFQAKQQRISAGDAEFLKKMRIRLD